MKKLEGRTAIVTGASSGVGRGLAKVLAENGANVCVCARRLEKLEELKAELEAEGAKALPVACDVADAEGKMLIPGLIDQHVHVTGGGGEGSFCTRTPELEVSELVRGGITTVVGLLGTDGITRSVENLYAKTAALNEEGVTAYMMTGAYGYPSPTITGAADRDVVFIKEVLGLKLAISDHRAPNITVRELIQGAGKVRVAGMLSGKPGVVILHMGDEKSGLKPVLEALEEGSVPIRIFRPTHVNRNGRLLEEGYDFLEKGGYIDLTCGISKDAAPGNCIAEAIKRGIPLDHITVSSDGHGSWSNYAEDGTLIEMGVSGVDALFRELTRMVTELGMPLEDALPYMTSQVAECLGLFPKKGCIRKGADADMLLLGKDMSLDSFIARGQIFMRGGEVIRKGTYEK